MSRPRLRTRRESPSSNAPNQALELKFFRDDADSTSSGSPTRDDVDDAEASDSAHAVTERFHDAGGECYMTVPVGNDDEQHHETMRIESKVAKRWIQYQAHLAGMMLQDREIKMIQSEYVATAYYEGPVHEVAQRIYQPDDDTIWLDLCDPLHRAIKITPNAG